MIVYLISSNKGINTGKGGHYYSLMTIAEEMSKKEKVILINIGNIKAQALEKYNGELIYLKSEYYNIFSILWKLFNLFKEADIKAIHSFDKHSIFYGRVISMILGVPLFCTKCGGPSYDSKSNFLSRYYPKIKNQTVFHSDDLYYFKKKDCLESLHLISGRVKIDIRNVKMSREIETFFFDAEIKFMRICRIGEFYFSTIESIINLLEKQLVINSHSKLLIIGHVEDKKYMTQLNNIIIGKNLKDKVLILTDSYHTLEASKFLHYSNVVLGTGRSFMEAAAYGHIMFAPIKNSLYPALVTSKNIDEFEQNNFSTRTTLNKNTDFLSNQIYWMNIINNQFDNSSYQVWIKKQFESKYNIESALKDYCELYKKIRNKELFSFDLILNFFIQEIYLIIRWFR